MKKKYIKEVKSAPHSLNRFDIEKVKKDMLFFAIVPLMFYVSAVLSTIGTQGHVLSWSDFIPSNATMIAIVSWILNQVLNLARKYVQ